MRYIGLIVAGVFLFGFYSWARASETDFTPFFDFYSDNHLSSAAAGRGYTGVAGSNDLSGAVLNPATLALSGRYQVYLEYAYKNKLPWLPELQHDLGDISLNTLHPSIMAGIGYRRSRFLQVGILYYTNNSYRFNQGTSQWTDENGNVLGTFSSYTNYRVQTFAVPVAVQHGQKLVLKAGVNFGLTHYSVSDNLFPQMYGKAGFYRFIPKAGIVLTDGGVLSVGATYQPGFKQTVTETWTGGLPPLKDTFGPLPFPRQVGLGVCYQMKAFPLKALLDYDLIQASVDSDLVDRHDVHFGMEFGPVRNFTLRTGFFTQNDYRKSGIQWLDQVGAYDQKFITLGGTYQRGPLTLQASVMDSHWLSSGMLKQTYVQGGIRYDIR